MDLLVSYSEQDIDNNIVDSIIDHPEVLIKEDTKNEMDQLRFKAQFRLKLSFEKIFEKYGKEIESDEIDLNTGEIVVDHGTLSSLDWKPMGANVEEINDEELEYCRDLFDSLVGELDREEALGGVGLHLDLDLDETNNTVATYNQSGDCHEYDNNYNNEYPYAHGNHNNYHMDSHNDYTLKRQLPTEYTPYIGMIKRIRYIEKPLILRYIQQPVVRITRIPMYYSFAFSVPAILSNQKDYFQSSRVSRGATL